jgi:5'-3' exoribonuclease 1
MVLLFGNHYIPNLPLFCGNQGVLQDIILVYMEVLPTLSGYMNENGQLNLSRFQKFMKRLASLDLKYLKSIRAEVEPGKKKHDRKRRGQPANEDEQSHQNFIRAHKQKHYEKKMKLCKVDERVDSERIRSHAEDYIRGIQWVLHHYYDGVCSWSWFYQNYYAPFVSDFHDFTSLELSYDKGQPLLPYQHLLAVLPASSKELVPLAYQNLMSAQQGSPISDYYPSVSSLEVNISS